MNRWTRRANLGPVAVTESSDRQIAILYRARVSQPVLAIGDL